MRKFQVIKYIILLMVIFLLSTWLIILANGYKINPHNYKIERTGLINIESTPNDVDVYINGELKSTKTPYKLAEIFPDRYDVKLSKQGFFDWTETLYVEQEKVVERGDIVLFYQKPEEIELTNSEIEFWRQKFTNIDDSQDKNLYIKDGSEIWFGDIFITRLSKDIKKVTWYYDKKHILYQIDSKICLMDSNGSNIVTLVNLPNNNLANFISDDRGQSLIYEADNNVKKIKITQQKGVIDSLTPDIIN